MNESLCGAFMGGKLNVYVSRACMCLKRWRTKLLGIVIIIFIWIMLIMSGVNMYSNRYLFNIVISLAKALKWLSKDSKLNINICINSYCTFNVVYFVSTVQQLKQKVLLESGYIYVIFVSTDQISKEKRNNNYFMSIQDFKGVIIVNECKKIKFKIIFALHLSINININKWVNFPIRLWWSYESFILLIWIEFLFHSMTCRSTYTYMYHPVHTWVERICYMIHKCFFIAYA